MKLECQMVKPADNPFFLYATVWSRYPSNGSSESLGRSSKLPQLSWVKYVTNKKSITALLVSLCELPHVEFDKQWSKRGKMFTLDKIFSMYTMAAHLSRPSFVGSSTCFLPKSTKILIRPETWGHFCEGRTFWQVPTTSTTSGLRRGFTVEVRVGIRLELDGGLGGSLGWLGPGCVCLFVVCVRCWILPSVWRREQEVCQTGSPGLIFIFRKVPAGQTVSSFTNQQSHIHFETAASRFSNKCYNLVRETYSAYKTAKELGATDVRSQFVPSPTFSNLQMLTLGGWLVNVFQAFGILFSTF